MADYFTEKVEEAKTRIPTMEHSIARGLIQPFNGLNSGSRKIMFGVHIDHHIPPMNGEQAIIETGYEIRYGDLSSSITAAEANYVVTAKIPKFSFSPNHHYWLILEDRENKRIDMVERISYQYITEEYGYLFNNQYMDNLMVGSYIPKDTIVQKSLAFDEYNNRKDGINFNVCYLSLDQNMEDSVIMSESAAKRMKFPLIKPVQIMINENNIPLNLYGDERIYKCIPDIGEMVRDSVLIALRKEKKEEMVFTESVDRLRKIMMSDEKKLLTGRVIDVNIYCNNPENLDSYHNSQFKMYYNELQRASNEIVSAVTPYLTQGYTISYELEQLYANSKRVLNHDQYIDKKPFSNIILEVVVLEENDLKEGDKVSNRYGGKGVLSKILPDNEMPRFGEDDELVDVLFNSYTMYNRQNPGQVMEFSINHVGHSIIKEILKGKYSIQESFNMILKFVDIVVPEQGEYLRNTISMMSEDELRFFLESFIKEGEIHISTKPITDGFDIDRLALLYDTFPFATHMDLKVPIKDSNGAVRLINARRKVIVGKEYIYRLKQFAEEKFSATSLSATNIRGENVKSKANKNFLELHSNTPIRFGNMEINNYNHLGPEAVIENLMIHSVSPHARKTVKQMYTCDPYNINIRLDNEATNRGAEIINTRLKTIGRRLVFKKVKKERVKTTIAPIYFVKDPYVTPISFISDKNTDVEKYYREQEEFNAKKDADPNVKHPFRFYGIDVDRRRKQAEINKRAYENMKKSRRQRLEEAEGV